MLSIELYLCRLVAAGLSVSPLLLQSVEHTYINAKIRISLYSAKFAPVKVRQTD